MATAGLPLQTRPHAPNRQRPCWAHKKSRASYQYGALLSAFVCASLGAQSVGVSVQMPPRSLDKSSIEPES